ncbi:MAG: methyltransferase domain-containing protein [Ilumatobacteraceae bacterium]
MTAATGGESSYPEFGALAELTALAGARNFADWIVDQFEPHLDGDVLDVGAGLGTISLRIAERHPSARITALEPAPNVYPRLVANTDGHVTIAPRQHGSADWHRECDDRVGDDSVLYDTVLYVNVLEHVRADASELRSARDLLRPDGVLGLCVPAMPSLYGEIDRISGHHRRYRRDELADLVRAAGFRIDRIHHLDALGVAPYWFTYRLLGVRHVSGSSTALYDRVLVRIGRRLERTFGPPSVGKNLIVVARRTD